MGLLLWTTAGFAACPRDPGTPLPRREELVALDAELARFATDCAYDAGYVAYRGAVLNALGRPQDGAAFLEQALLLDPNLAGAQLDYAEALAALGDTTAAIAFVRDLLARTDVPPQLRTHLVRRLNALDALQRFDTVAGLRAWIGQDWRAIASVTVKGGYDSNLNSAPSRGELSLTVPGGELILLLSAPFRERGGGAGLGELRGQLARQFQGGATLQFYGEARARVSPSASDTDYQQGQGVVAWTHPLGSGDALVSVGGTRLHYGGDDLYSAVRVGLSRDWRLDRCQPRVGLETEWRRYPAARELEGRYYAASTGIACLLGTSRASVALRGGVDSAQRDRPGGDQRQVDVRFAWLSTLGSGTLLADLVLSRQQDDTGFSPFLANNAARRVDRASMLLEYAYPLAPSWSIVASFEATVQRSNLPLFDVSGRAVYIGVRWLTSR